MAHTTDTDSEPGRIGMAAELLFQARKTLAPVAPISTRCSVTDAESAYRVQEANTLRWLQAGRRISGRKIGLTSKAVQAQLNVDQPDYGMLWDDLGFTSGEDVPYARFMQPRVEAEIAFVMSRDLVTEHLSLHEVTAAVGYAMAAVEIVDSAVAEWKITLADTIADNASSGGYVLGTEPRFLSGLDLRLCGMVLSVNGQPAATGVGAACLGHPLLALMWLARKMVAVGRPLRAGDLVMSGALGPMIPVSNGDQILAEIQGFAPISIRFTT